MSRERREKERDGTPLILDTLLAPVDASTPLRPIRLVAFLENAMESLTF